MPSILIELDREGIKALLGSSEVQAMLTRKARAVAAAATSRGIKVDGDPGKPLPIEVRDAGNARRARALVVADHEAGLAVEAKHRLLVGALDAARGA